MSSTKIYNLILEVTRRCNMSCAHCMRGDSQSMDADPILIPKLFEGVSEIETLTFSGGEPTLNTPYMKAVVDYIIEYRIPVHGCFIATNAKVYSPELVKCVRRLWEAEQGSGDQLTTPAKWVIEHGDEEEYSCFSIAISGDDYHEAIPSVNIQRYFRSGFFSNMKINNGKRYIFARGRGALIPGAFDRPIAKLSAEMDNDTLVVDEAYVSCTGTVVTDCDLPFEDIDSGNSPAYLGKVTKRTSLATVLQKAAKIKNIA